MQKMQLPVVDDSEVLFVSNRDISIGYIVLLEKQAKKVFSTIRTCEILKLYIP